MDQTVDDPVVLRRCVRDLVALSTLPAVWAQSQPRDVAQGLSQLLRRMLLADVVFVRARDAGGPFDHAVTAEGACDAGACAALARVLGDTTSADPGDAIVVAHPLTGRPLRAVRVPLGHDAELGVVVAACSAATFPSHTDRLLLSVAANAATVVLQHRATEELLRQANRAKDDFLATVSHELRTPVNAVLGWASMLSQGAISGDRVAAAVAAIERNARAQVTLIDDLLDVSRFVTGGIRLDLGDLAVVEAVEEALDAVRLTADARRIALRFPGGDPHLRIRGDRNRVRQMVWNLLSNAVKFTPPGGGVDVAVAERGREVTIVVRDSGIGIDPAVLPRMFDRFRQGDPSTTREYGGLGLGLWIVRHLAELHGGSATGTSDGPGTGSTFTIVLPVEGPVG